MPKKIKTETSTLPDALSEAYGIVSELNEELSSWYDNLPENLQGSSKGEALQEATGVLECIEDIDLPDCVSEATTVTYSTLARKPSRSTRCYHAIGILQAVVDVLRTQVEELRDDSKDDEAEILADEEAEDAADVIEQTIDELEAHISDLEGVEFPGMFS